MSHELPPYSTRTIPQRPDSPVPVANANRVNMRWVIVRHTSVDPIELERAKALRKQSKSIHFIRDAERVT
ncbi:MAG: hypothetical protein CMG35_03415 [Candidatus Marinimicrobia bacterium]|nr:hypothetical protein [Candidatus Neomarinimicrobiota bacterium]